MARHRSFPAANWALSRERVAALEVIYRKFEPQEVLARFAWLFDENPELPEGLQADWKKAQSVLDDQRRDAARAIHKEAGAQGLREFVGAVQSPFRLGITCGSIGVLDNEENQLLSEHLAADDPRWQRFACGFVVGRLNRHGRDWARKKLVDVRTTWTSRQRAEVLLLLPQDRDTWTLLETQGSDVEQLYWKRAYPHVSGNSTEIEYAARKLLHCERPRAAVDLLVYNVANPELIVEVLEKMLSAPETETRSGDLSYQLGELFKKLDITSGVDEGRVARLEWAFLPLFQHRGPSPKLLHRELARNPDFFAEVAALVYQAENEEPGEISDEQEARARRGHELLESWRTVPGTAPDGSIDPGTLKDWMRRARSALAASGRGVIGDQIIGKLLSHAAQGGDAIWPPEVVREVIEEFGNADLERGIELGVYNNRGMVSKSLTEGGEQERRIAEQYGAFASKVSDRWPVTAAMLRRIENRYRLEAGEADIEAELRKDDIWD